MGYEPVEALRGSARGWSWRHHRRMDPNVVYYAVVGGAAALVGVVLDIVGVAPWWVVAGLGLLGAWAFTWLTALDDLRHPGRSLGILAATIRDPFDATRIRAVRYGIPLYAPPTAWGGSRLLSGGGLSYPRALLGPVRPSATVTWSGDDAVVTATTDTRPSGPPRPGRLPRGIGHQLAVREDDPALAGVTVEHLADRVQSITVDVDGRPLPATLLDLSDRGLGWFAEARVDDDHVLELAGEGVDLGGFELVRLAVDDLPGPGAG